MMTWEIALGIFALASFVVSIVTLVVKVTSAISTLNETVSNLNETIENMRKNSHETHRELFVKVNDHDKTLTDHEIRIQHLENH